jgi:hypothetical protein
MSKITGTDHGEAFALRVVSGMVVDGSLIVTWATGDFASSQIDWGYDSSVPNQTDKPLLLAGERGYNPKKDNPRLVRYHRVAFPQTYVDTEHFFRAISVNRKGEKVISRVYSVFVTSRMFSMSQCAETRVEVSPVLVGDHSQVQPAGLSSLPLADEKPKGQSGTMTTGADSSPIAVSSPSPVGNKTTMETTFTLTLDAYQ